jgi:hypothetical protein
MSSERSTPGAPYHRERPAQGDLMHSREQVTGRRERVDDDQAGERLTDGLAVLSGAHRLADGVVWVGPLDGSASGAGARTRP